MRSRRAGWAFILSLSGLLVLSAAPPGRASGQGSSQSGSNGSSDSKDSNSSNGSNDSSNSSKDSSARSQGSSKDSNNSTQNSPKNSSDWTSDWTTNSHGAHVFSIAMAIVAVGATVVGLIVVNNSHRQDQQRATIALAEFMRRQHPLLTHDVTMAGGPVFDAWAHDLGLDPRDRARVRRALDGSSEQGLLLGALDGPIDEARVRRFAAAFLRVTERALGRTRTTALVSRAARATGLG